MEKDESVKISTHANKDNSIWVTFRLHKEYSYESVVNIMNSNVFNVVKWSNICYLENSSYLFLNAFSMCDFNITLFINTQVLIVSGVFYFGKI